MILSVTSKLVKDHARVHLQHYFTKSESGEKKHKERVSSQKSTLQANSIGELVYMASC